MSARHKNAGNTESPLKLGQIMLNAQLISGGQLEDALRRQQSCAKPLGEILTESGALSPGLLQVALTLQQGLAGDAAIETAAGRRELLGELLVMAGRITSEQLGCALEEQQRTGHRLGEIALGRGWINQAELGALLAFQSGQEHAGAAGPLRLGNILVANGDISAAQLEQALGRQTACRRPLGAMLVEAGLLQPQQINHAVGLQRRLLAAALVTLLALASLGRPGEAAADPSSAQLTVTAFVPKQARLRVLAQPRAVVVTESDVARGYVEMPAASTVEIRSNSPNGYALVFDSQSDLVRQTQVTGLGAEARLGAGGGALTVPPAGGRPGTVTIDLGFRFVLNAIARPGVYAWPMRMSVVPL